MFEWKRAYVGECLVAGSGMMWMKDKIPKSLNIQDVLEMIKANPRKGYYEKIIKRRVTLGQCVERGNFEDIGLLKEMSTSIDLWRLKSDRIFDKLPKNGQQLLTTVYESKPKKVLEI